MKRTKIVVLALCVGIAGMLWAQEAFDPFAEGRQLFEQQKYQEALVKFQKSLEYLPHDPTILSWIGATYLSLSKYAEAEQALTEALERGGTSYKFFELLSATQARQAKWDAALATIRRFREVGVEEEKKQNEEKLRTLEAALHLEKRLECLRREPADRACADQELDAAWQIHAKDPAQDVSFTQIWTSKGVAEQDPARKAEAYARAETAARSWLQSAPEADKPKAKMALAIVLVRQKKYDDALPFLEQIRSADPANCAAKLELARAYLGKEDYAQAKTFASEAIECRPEETQGYLLRATAEYGLDDCPSVVRDGAEYKKRAAGKEAPKFVAYCRSVLDSQRAAVDEKQKHAEDMKRWIQQQLEEGDKAVEEALKPRQRTPTKKPDEKSKKSDTPGS